jgi:hypothetical protein
MGKFRKLEIKRLLKELDYIKSDFECKNEMVSDADNSFMIGLNLFLEKNSILKELFEKTLNKNLEEILVKDELASEDLKEDIPKKKSNKKLKKIYREIAKSTHPDKVNDRILNDFYIKVGSMYDKDDIVGIYNICDLLGIEYEIGEEEHEIIKSKINTLKERILFLESTFTWKWYNTDSNSIKDKIMLDYIKSKII